MEKDYFNLEDVAKQLKCGIGDLLHYAATRSGKPTICKYLREERHNRDTKCHTPKSNQK